MESRCQTQNELNDIFESFFFLTHKMLCLVLCFLFVCFILFCLVWFLTGLYIYIIVSDFVSMGFLGWWMCVHQHLCFLCYFFAFYFSLSVLSYSSLLVFILSYFILLVDWLYSNEREKEEV